MFRGYQKSNNAFIGAGFVVLGGVIVEDEAIVGANAVVKNVEKCSIVCGVPAIHKNKDI